METEWKQVKLGDYADFSNGINFGKDYYSEGVKLITVSDFKDRLNPNYDTLVEVDSSVVRESDLLRNDDIVFVRSNGNKELVGRCMIIKNLQTKLTYSGFCIRARFNNFENASPSYFVYYFKSPLFRKSIANSSVGANIQNLNQEILSSHKVALPPLKIQQKITNILSRYDEAIENNNKRIKLLEQMAQNLYKEWFVRFRFPGWQNAEFENGIPKGWKVEKVGNLLKRLSFGKTYKKDELEKEGNVIVIDQSTDDCLGFHNEEPSHKADFENPIILFGDHSCKFVFMTKNFSLGENVIPIQAEDCNSYFLYRAIDGIIEMTEYKRHWSMLCSQKILVPAENLQNEFCIVYKSFVKQIESLKTKNQNLAKQRDLLLPRLMSGKLEVK